MIALIGNPNCGKSALFNKLTNSNQKVGNFAGVTVSVKKGKYKNIDIVDLPGIYSLNPYTNDEKVTINYLKNNNINLIINVIDINILSRSLYLTYMLKELNVPMVIVLNKDDGINTKVDNLKLQKLIGLDIISISVLKNKNIDKLQDIILNINNKYINNKIRITKKNDEQNIINIYKRIDMIISKVIIKSNNNKIGRMIDNILLNKYISIFISLLVLISIYYIAIKIAGNFFINLINSFNNYILEYIIQLLNKINISSILKSLIIDGIINGLGVIVTFIPQIVIITFIFSFLEETGYISRMAISFDKILRKIGLSFKSFFPMLLGNSCSAIAVMSTRTIKNKNEKYLTNLLIPFIPCSAKIPIILFFLNTFYHNSFFLFLSFYLIMIIIIILISIIFSKNKCNDYIMEIPSLKLPNLKIVLMDTYQRLKDFIIRMVSIILLFSILNWFLLSFDFNLNFNCSMEKSILYQLLDKISFLTKPFLGIKDSGSLVAIISGLVAKEQVVSTLNVIGVKLNYISAYSFICFNLFTFPCINTLFAIKNECGLRYLLFVIFIELFVAFIVSTLIFRVMLWIF